MNVHRAEQRRKCREQQMVQHLNINTQTQSNIWTRTYFQRNYFIIWIRMYDCWNCVRACRNKAQRTNDRSLTYAKKRLVCYACACSMHCVSFFCYSSFTFGHFVESGRRNGHTSPLMNLYFILLFKRKLSKM